MNQFFSPTSIKNLNPMLAERGKIKIGEKGLASNQQRSMSAYYMTISSSTFRAGMPALMAGSCGAWEMVSERQGCSARMPRVLTSQVIG
jgi:hypothetical protein